MFKPSVDPYVIIYTEVLKHCGFCALLESWWSAVSTSPLIDLQSAFVFQFLVIFCLHCLSLYKRKLVS